MPRLDPGWLFVAAGLAVCAAGVLAPAQRALEASSRQLERLIDEKSLGDARLAAHGEFLEQIEARDPVLLRRLAASQLNLVPAEKSPLLVASSAHWSFPSWIEPAVPARRAEATPSSTLLDRLTGGRARLWFMAGGVLAVFAGLLIDGGPSDAERRRMLVPHWGRAAK